MSIENKNIDTNAQKETPKLSEQELRGKIGLDKFVCFFRQGQSGSFVGQVTGWSKEKDMNGVPCPEVKIDGVVKVLNDDYCVEGVFDTKSEAENHYHKAINQEKTTAQSDPVTSQEEIKETEPFDPKKDIPGIGRVVGIGQKENESFKKAA